MKKRPESWKPGALVVESKTVEEAIRYHHPLNRLMLAALDNQISLMAADAVAATKGAK